MNKSSTFLDALPVAASSPLALFGYLAALTASAVLVWRVRRNQNLLARIKDLPGSDRKAAIQAEMGVVLPKRITAEQWLRSRLHQYYFMGFLVVIVCATLIGVIAFTGRVGAAPGASAPDAASNSPAADQANSNQANGVAPPSRNPPPSVQVSAPAGTQAGSVAPAQPQMQAAPQPPPQGPPTPTEVFRAGMIAGSDPEMSIELLRGFFARGFDVNGVIDDHRGTLLQLAAERCGARVVNWLLTQGANQNHANDYRDTALTIANARCGRDSPTAAALQPH